MNDPLFPYQHIGAHFLWKHKRALLADEMGLGKSCQAIRGCDLAHASKILVVCPAVARANWEREFLTFSVQHLNIHVAYTGAARPLEMTNVFIVSYDLLDGMVADLKAIKWDVLIADEAHFLKNRKAVRTKALFAIAKAAKYVWFLSGTPAPNHAGELWPILKFTGATELDYWPFMDRYLNYTTTQWDGIKVRGLKGVTTPELKAALSGIMLRRKKEDVLKDLPPIFFQDTAVEAKPFDEQLFFFDNFGRRDPQLDEKLATQRAQVEWLVDNLGLTESGVEALEASKTALSTLRRYTGMQKVASITEMVKDDLANGVEKIVIMAMHRDVIESLRQSLAEFKPVTIYGGTPADKRDKNVQTFQTNKHCRVFIGQIVAAGTAITLTAAHHVLFAECSWVPAENAQAAMRCHRIGQTKPVTVRFAYIPGTIDEAVTRALKRKSADLANVFG